MRNSYFVFVLTIFLGSSPSDASHGDDSQSHCDSYCFGVLKPCMANLAAVQKRTEACEAAVTIARLALTDKRLETFGSLLSLPQETENSTQLGIMSSSRSARRECNNTFTQLGSKYYYIEKEQTVSWHVALKNCQKQGGHLATIKDHRELDAIKLKLTPGARYWIDVTDQFQEGKYVSISNGSVANFLKWDTNEPTNDGDCVDVIVSNEKIAMNDNNCSKGLLFICEAFSEFKTLC